MGRERVRVGVEVADGGGAKEEIEAPMVPVGSSRDADDGTSLDEKRARVQKELLRKKKAERRAHAKQRKKASEPTEDPPTDEPPLVETQPDNGPNEGLDQDYRETPSSVKSETMDGADSETVKKKKGKKKKTQAKEQAAEPTEALLDLTDGDERRRDEEVAAENDRAHNNEGVATETLPVDEPIDPTNCEAVAVPEIYPASKVEDPSEHLQSKPPSVEPSIPVGPSLSHDDLPTRPAEEEPALLEQHASSVSIAFSAPTVSVNEPVLTPPEDEAIDQQLELHPKKTKATSVSPLSNEAAAKTIQHAVKKSLIKKTKHTLQQARSFIRHSSKVLAEDSLVTPSLEHIRPAIVPPLVLRPRSPPPSSSSSSCFSSSSSSSRSSDSSSSSYSSGSSSTSTLSHRSSSSSRSRSSSSSSHSSDASSERRRRKRSRSRHKPRDQAERRPSGPPSAMLRLAQPEKHQRRNYGELHHYMATVIQARVRGIRGRSLAAQRAEELEREIRAEALREIQQEASVRIQAHVKGFLLRKRLDVEADSTSARRGSYHRHHRHHHRRNKPNSVVPHGGGGEEEKDEEDPDRVAVWPDELNLEPLDDWDELGSVANGSGSTMAQQFLSKGELRVFCGTWNLHAKKPKHDLRRWIALNRYHVVAIGTEECVHSIAKSVVFTSKKPWESQLKETLGSEYVLVAAHALTAIHLAVFVHESVLPLLHHIQSDAVATGLGNQLGNKGGVGVAFSIARTSLAFVNCHLDAHQHNTSRRNASFHRINQELQLYPANSPSSQQPLGKTTSARFSSSSLAVAGSGAAAVAASRRAGTKAPVSDCFDRVFWFGDLNYRINGTRRMIDLLLLHSQHAVLRANDQLSLEMQQGAVFQGFQEGPLHFRPTYKFDKHSDAYDSGAKQRIPSWTDRVLFRSSDAGAIELLSYRSHMQFQTSDHRPVGAVFHVRFRKAENKKGGEGEEQAGGEHGTGGAAADAEAFARVLARGYKATQTRSEVCAVQ